jgi:hypothetical protein
VTGFEVDHKVVTAILRSRANSTIHIASLNFRIE